MAITEHELESLGFAAIGGHRWNRNLQTLAEYPTRVQVSRPSHGSFLVFIEQAEYTGQYADGIGESDWDWSRADQIAIVLNDAQGLVNLINALSYGQFVETPMREHAAKVYDEVVTQRRGLFGRR